MAECIGTYVLVLAGCGAVMTHERFGTPDHLGVSLVFGLVVAAVIYSLGHISGAHINPAITIAFAMTGHFAWRRVPGYLLAQSAGALAAAASLLVVFGGGDSLGATAPVIGVGRTFAVEVVLSAFLMVVIMAVATDSRVAAGIAGVAVGGTVGLEALWAGPLTGASMNPARSLGPALVAGDVGALWIYLLAPVIGMVLGAALYQAVAGRALLPGIESALPGLRPLSSAPGSSRGPSGILNVPAGPITSAASPRARDSAGGTAVG
jgi:aquaporin NIP